MNSARPSSAAPRPDDASAVTELIRRAQKLETLLQNALADTAAAGISCLNSSQLLERMSELEATWNRVLTDVSRETEFISQGLEQVAVRTLTLPAGVRDTLNTTLRRVADLAQAFDEERNRLLARLAKPIQAESSRLRRHIELLRQYQHQPPAPPDGWKT